MPENGKSSTETQTFFDGRKIGSIQKRFLYIAAMAYVFDQMDVTNFGLVAPTLMKQYGWTMQQIANVNSFNMFGMFLGALLGGWLADKIGRKKALLAVVMTYSITSLANAIFTNYHVFATMRFLNGVGTVGMLTIAMVYISEMMPSESRGKYQALTIACGTVGIPVCAILAKVIIPLSPNAWRYIFLLGGLGIVLAYFCVVWIKESPRWLVSKGRLDEAQKMLDEIVPGAKLPENATELAQNKDCGYIEAFRVLFKRDYLRRTFTLFFAVFGVTLGGFYLTSFYMTVHTQMGFSQAIMLNLAVFQYFLVPFGDYLVSFISDRGGRKVPLVIWLLVLGILFTIQGMCKDVLPITILLLVKGLFMSGCMTLTWTYLAESYPTHVRSGASGILFGSGRLLSAFAVFTVPMVYQAYGYFGINLVNGLLYFIPGVIVALIGGKTATISLETLNPTSGKSIVN